MYAGLAYVGEVSGNHILLAPQLLTTTSRSDAVLILLSSQYSQPLDEWTKAVSLTVRPSATA